MVAWTSRRRRLVTRARFRTHTIGTTLSGYQPYLRLSPGYVLSYGITKNSSSGRRLRIRRLRRQQKFRPSSFARRSRRHQRQVIVFRKAITTTQQEFRPSSFARRLRRRQSQVIGLRKAITTTPIQSISEEHFDRRPQTVSHDYVHQCLCSPHVARYTPAGGRGTARQCLCSLQVTSG